MASESPLLDSLNLVVSDMEKTLAFYRLLGVEIPEEGVWRTDTGTHHVEVSMPGGVDLDFDSVDLAKRYNEGWRRPEGGSASLVGFKVVSREEVDACYARLTEAGHTGLQKPYDAFWGARHAIVEDPDGRDIGIMSPSDPNRTTGPPEV